MPPPPPSSGHLELFALLMLLGKNISQVQKIERIIDALRGDSECRS